MVFVDARTGNVYNPPLAIGRWGDRRIGLPMFQGGIAEVAYRLTSRLFKNEGLSRRAEPTFAGRPLLRLRFPMG